MNPKKVKCPYCEELVYVETLRECPNGHQFYLTVRGIGRLI